jgi:hypothetical protein
MRKLVRSILLLSSGALFAVALWLVSVTLLVLPHLDPAHLSMWRMVAVAMFAYATLSVFVLRGSVSRILRGVVVVSSGVAVAAGSLAIASKLRASGEGGHFEGYLVLMGLIVAGHGIAAILNHFLTMSHPVHPVPPKLAESVR